MLNLRLSRKLRVDFLKLFWGGHRIPGEHNTTFFMSCLISAAGANENNFCRLMRGVIGFLKGSSILGVLHKGPIVLSFMMTLWYFVVNWPDFVCVAFPSSLTLRHIAPSGKLAVLWTCCFVLCVYCDGGCCQPVIGKIKRLSWWVAVCRPKKDASVGSGFQRGGLSEDYFCVVIMFQRYTGWGGSPVLIHFIPSGLYVITQSYIVK